MSKVYNSIASVVVLVVVLDYVSGINLIVHNTHRLTYIGTV
jgi:hypothetical protein